MSESFGESTSLIDSNTLALARERLKEFAFIDTVEGFKALLKTMAGIFNWKLPSSVIDY